MPLDGGSNGGSEDGTTHLRFMLGRGQIGRGELGETMEVPLLEQGWSVQIYASEWF
jgi:hypothetical protein